MLSRESGRRDFEMSMQPTHRASSQPGDFGESLEAVFADEMRDQLQSATAQLAMLESPATRAVACDQLHRLFHTIKGSAGLVGFAELASLALGLEKFFAAGAPDAGAEEAQQRLDGLFAFADREAPALAARFEGRARPAGGAELLAAFAGEAREGLDLCERLLLTLERQPQARELVHEVFRQVHTLKGAAAAVGLDNVATHLHEAESLLETAAAADSAAPAPLAVDRLLALVDTASRLVAAARPVDDERQPASAAAPMARDSGPSRSVGGRLEDGAAIESTESGVTTVRVPMAVLDALVEQAGQLVVARAQMEQKIRQFGDLREKLQVCRRRLAETAEGLDRRIDDRLWHGVPAPHQARGKGPEPDGATAFFTDLEFDKYDDTAVLARSVIEAATDTGEIGDELGRVIEALGEQSRHVAKVSSSVQRRVASMRRVAIETVLQRLTRPVRDAAQQLGKQVELHCRGGELRIDRAVAEALHGPLLHVLRNAVAHGIETPAARAALGKDPTGSIRISASLNADGVVVAVEDDGAGLDLDAIAARARALALLADGAQPSRAELLRIIVSPRFSTQARADDLAGRGVGLDAVARQIAALEGRLEIESDSGAGTVVRMHVPLASPIEEALLLEVGSQVFALPVRCVEQAVPIEVGALRRDGERLWLSLKDAALPVVMMSGLAGEPEPADSAVVVVVRAGDVRLGLVVDRVRAQQEIAVRPLGRLLDAHPFCGGAAVSGAGTVVLVLHPSRLLACLSIELPRRAVVTVAGEMPLHAAGEASRILVVDDSISVRKHLARLLEGAGCEVETAVDGMDALEKLAQGHFRLVITDLEMPRMHGYELMAEMQRHPRWQLVPTIVCTSRSSEKHRQRARDLGATGYLTKPFTQEELLAAVANADALRHVAPPMVSSADNPPQWLNSERASALDEASRVR